MRDDPVGPLRRQLVDHILRLAARTNMHVAAYAMGIDPPRLSDLRRGRIEHFSLERLIRMLDAVGRRVRMDVEALEPGAVRWWECVQVQRARRRRRKSPRRSFPWDNVGASGDPDGTG